MKTRSSRPQGRKLTRTAVLTLAIMLVLGTGLWLRWRHFLPDSFPPTLLEAWIPCCFVGAFVVIVLAVVLHHIHETRTIRRVVTAALANRLPMTDEEFGGRFYEPHIAPVASRLRRLLAENLDCDVVGMIPSDDFEKWLSLFPGLDSPADCFFEELAIEFQVTRDCPWPQQFNSFDELVRFVAQTARASQHTDARS